jgi:hypothetical protein
VDKHPASAMRIISDRCLTRQQEKRHSTRSLSCAMPGPVTGISRLGVAAATGEIKVSFYGNAATRSER